MATKGAWKGMKKLFGIFFLNISMIQTSEYSPAIYGFWSTHENENSYYAQQSMPQLTPYLEKGIRSLTGTPPPSPSEETPLGNSKRSRQNSTSNQFDPSESSCCCCLLYILKAFKCLTTFHQPYIDNNTFSDAFPDALSLAMIPKQ